MLILGDPERDEGAHGRWREQESGPMRAMLHITENTARKGAHEFFMGQSAPLIDSPRVGKKKAAQEMDPGLGFFQERS